MKKRKFLLLVLTLPILLIGCNNNQSNDSSNVNAQQEEKLEYSVLEVNNELVSLSNYSDVETSLEVGVVDSDFQVSQGMDGEIYFANPEINEFKYLDKDTLSIIDLPKLDVGEDETLGYPILSPDKKFVYYIKNKFNHSDSEKYYDIPVDREIIKYSISSKSFETIYIDQVNDKTLSPLYIYGKYLVLSEGLLESDVHNLVFYNLNTNQVEKIIESDYVMGVYPSIDMSVLAYVVSLESKDGTFDPTNLEFLDLYNLSPIDYNFIGEIDFEINNDGDDYEYYNDLEWGDDNDALYVMKTRNNKNDFIKKIDLKNGAVSDKYEIRSECEYNYFEKAIGDNIITTCFDGVVNNIYSYPGEKYLTEFLPGPTYFVLSDLDFLFLFNSVSDFYDGHYHPVEYINKNLYLVKRIGYDMWGDDEWHDELWKINKDNQELIYSSKGIEFRASSEENGVVLLDEQQYLVILDKDHKVVTRLKADDFVLESDLDYPESPGFKLLGWSSDGKYFFSDLIFANQPTLLKINGETGDVQTFSLPVNSLTRDFAFNTDTEKLVYGNYPILLDANDQEKYDSEPQEIYLKVYDITTGDIVDIDQKQYGDYEPRWGDNGELYYYDNEDRRVEDESFI